MKDGAVSGGKGFLKAAAATSLSIFLLLLAARGGKYFPAAVAGEALILGLSGFLLWRGGGLFPGNARLLPPLLLLMLLQTASIAGSGCPEGAALSLSRFWTAVAFGLIARETWGSAHRRFYEATIAAVALVQAALLMGERLFGAAAPFLLPGNPQYGALWMCLAALGVASRRETPRRLRALLSAFLAGGVILSSVRSAEAGLAAGVLFLLWRRWGPRGAVSGVLGLAASFAALPPSWLDRVYKSGDPASWKRLDLWRTAWDGILHKPWLGWGPGQFEALYRLHARAQDGALLRFDHSTLFAHNDYLQAAAASGLPALLCLLWLLAVLFRSCPRERRDGAAVLFAGCVFSLFNFPFALPVNVFVAGAVAARALPEEPAASGPRLGAGGRLLSALFLGMAAFLLSRLPFAFEPGPPERAFYGRSAVLLEKGKRALFSSGGLEQADALLAEALRLAPGRAENWEASAILRSFQGKADEAEASLREALRLYPRNAVWWMELGWLESERGRPEEAARALHEALRAEPRFVQAAYGLGLLMRERGEEEKARRWLDRLRQATPIDGMEGLSPYAQAVLSRRFPPVLPERKR